MFHQNLAQFLRPRLISRTTKAQKEEAKRQGRKVQKTAARTLVEASMVCLRLVPDPVLTIPLDSTGWPSLDDSIIEETPATRWFHINYINFKDMQFTLFELEPSPEQPHPGRMVLTVPALSKPGVLRSCAVFADMNLTPGWTATWHRIISDKEQLSMEEFIPNKVEVVAMDPEILPEVKIWQGNDMEEFHAREAATKHKGHKSTQRKRKGQAGQAPTSKRRRGKGRGRGTPPFADDAGHEDTAAAHQPDAEDDHDDLDSIASATDASEAPDDPSVWEKLADVADKLPEEAVDAESGAPAAETGESAAAKGKAAGSKAPVSRPKLVVEEVFQIKADGQDIGSLHYNSRTHTLTARCNFEGHENCKRQRTVRKGVALDRGDPSGILLHGFGTAAISALGMNMYTVAVHRLALRTDKSPELSSSACLGLQSSPRKRDHCVPAKTLSQRSLYECSTFMLTRGCVWNLKSF